MNSRAKWAATLCCAVAFAAINQAQAADGKNYAGGRCVKWSSGGSKFYSYGSLGNESSSSSMHVDCPIMKHGGSTANGWVRVLDRHPSANVRCTLTDAYTITTDAVMYLWTSTRSSSGSAANHQSLSYGALSTNSFSHKYFSCEIPATSSGNKSWIAAYNVSEN